jgi:hypothetical protein
MQDGAQDGVAPYLRLFALKSDTKALDLRPSDQFFHRRLCRCHNIPADNLLQRLFEIPPKGHPITLITPSSTTAHERETPWSEWFPRHGWPVEKNLVASEELWVEAAALGLLEQGLPRLRTLLFHPCPLLAQYVDHIEACQQLSGLKRACIDVGVYAQLFALAKAVGRMWTNSSDLI